MSDIKKITRPSWRQFPAGDHMLFGEQKRVVPEAVMEDLPKKRRRTDRKGASPPLRREPGPAGGPV